MRRETGKENRNNDSGIGGRGGRRSLPARRWWLVVALAAVLAGVGLVISWEIAVWSSSSPLKPAQEDWIGSDDSSERPPGDVGPEVSALSREATEAARRLLEHFPDRPEAIDVAALLHLRMGRAEKALRCWQRCVELDERFAAAHLAMGQLARDKGETAMAAQHFQKAADLDPELPGVLFELADVLIKQGEFDTAQAVVEKSLARDPRFFPSLYHLGQIYLQRKEYAKARKTLEAALRSEPDFANAYFGLATACAKLGDRQQAAQYTQKFRELSARDEQAHRDRLKAADGTGDLRLGAAEVCTAAANVWLLHGEPQRAEELLVRACQLAPTHAGYADMLAQLYERQGRDEESLKTLTQASVSSPKGIAVQVHLGRLAAKMGRFEQAEQALQKAIELAPREARAYAMLADLHLQAGRKFPQAKRLAEKAVELEPAAQHLFLLALANRRLGDLPGAKSAIDRAVALEPGNPEYLRAQDLIRGSQGSDPVFRFSPGQPRRATAELQSGENRKPGSDP